MKKRRRSPVKGEILEWRTADLERKGNDGTYKQRAWWTLCSVRLLPSRVVVLACEGPCATCAAWSDGISEVARTRGCRPMSLGRSASLRPKGSERNERGNLVATEKVRPQGTEGG